MEKHRNRKRRTDHEVHERAGFPRNCLKEPRMFSNPQGALPLPRRRNSERYRKLAKDLVKASKDEKPEAIGVWAEKWVKSLVKSSGFVLTRQQPVAIQSW